MSETDKSLEVQTLAVEIMAMFAVDGMVKTLIEHAKLTGAYDDEMEFVQRAEVIADYARDAAEKVIETGESSYDVIDYMIGMYEQHIRDGRI